MLQRNQICFVGLLTLLGWLVPSRPSQGAPPPQMTAGEKSQEAALPAAKQELLGELSPQTEVPGPEIARHSMKEMFGSSAGKANADYSFDRSNLRFIARAKQGPKWVLIVDGKEGAVFEGLESVIAYEGHILYSAKRDSKWVKVLDDKEIGSAFDELGSGNWMFGKTGVEH